MRLRNLLILLLSVGALTQAPVLAGTIVIAHNGETDPSTEGFAYYAGSVGPVLGTGGVPAWQIQGSWDSSQYNSHLNASDTPGDWVLTAYLSNNTTTSQSGNETGPWVSYMAPTGVRFDLDLYSDGDGDQILEANPFGSSYGPTPTYPIYGLGSGFVLVQVAYSAANGSADYYVNGTEVISGYTGENQYFYDGLAFGADNGDFAQVQLQTGDMTTPEPASAILILAALAGLVWRRNRAA